MSEAVTWDDLEGISSSLSQKPLYAIDLTSEDEVLNWLKEKYASIKKQRYEYLERAKNNYLRYKGHQYFNQVYTPRDSAETQKKYTPQVVLPLISDAIDERTARLMEIKPGVVVLPKDDETRDKVDSKIAKRFIQHIEHKQKLDGKFQKLVRSSQIVGESFLWTRWNPDLGELLPETKLAKTEDGNPVATLLRQGDVQVVHKTAHWLFYDLAAQSWEDVDFCFIEELEDSEGLKLDYPEKKDKIKPDHDAKLFDFDGMEQVTLQGKVRKVTFYHRQTKYMPKGFEACFTGSALLKSGVLSYEHGMLPIDRLVDIENDEEIAGQSSIDKTRGIASTVNNLLNSMIKMFMLAGYAKWFVQAGSVDDNQLNNDVNIVKIKNGANAPVLAQANPVGQSTFAFLEQLKGWFYDFMKSNSVVRGEPPPGVTAGVALQYVSESESRRMTTSVANFNAVRLGVYEKILKTAAQFYQTDEERTLMIMGKDNKWENFPLDVEALKKDYSVLLQNTSGLSDSKAVRTQQLIDLNMQFPGAVPKEQVLEMTGLGQSDKFYDVATAAARAAEDENESIQDGKGQSEPAQWEDHIAHWKIHVQSMQPKGFKEKAGDQILMDMEDHVRAHEMLMMDIMAKNPAYAQIVQAECLGFPLFMEPPAPPPMGPEGMPLTPEEEMMMAEQMPPEEMLPPEEELPPVA